jgi:hypothetical protein
MNEDYTTKLLEEKINRIEIKISEIEKAIQGNGNVGLRTRISLLEKDVEEISKSIRSIRSLLWGEEGDQENSLLVIISRLNTKLDIYSVIVAGLGSLITGLTMYFGK